MNGSTRARNSVLCSAQSVTISCACAMHERDTIIHRQISVGKGKWGFEDDRKFPPPEKNSSSPLCHFSHPFFDIPLPSSFFLRLVHGYDFIFSCLIAMSRQKTILRISSLTMCVFSDERIIYELVTMTQQNAND